jgi:hypothetical protein
MSTALQTPAIKQELGQLWALSGRLALCEAAVEHRAQRLMTLNIAMSATSTRAVVRDGLCKKAGDHAIAGECIALIHTFFANAKVAGFARAAERSSAAA